LKQPASSNFISHSIACKWIPGSQTWASYEANDGKDIAGGSEVVRTSEQAKSGIGAQRSFMGAFTARGAENPEKQVTRKTFREYFVKGIVEDDLAYSMGEKPGMNKLLTYLLPRGFVVPSHQSVRRDLDILYTKMSDRLNHILQVCCCLSARAHL